MSSGAALIPLAALFLIPAAVAAVLVVVAVATAGAVVVMTARAATAGAQALAGGLVRLGQAMEAQADAYFEAQEASELWQLATAEVTRRNSQIASLSRQAEVAGASPDLPIPPPFDLVGKNLCEARAWCEQTDHQLAQARLEVHQAIETATSRRLAALLPAAGAGLISSADALARGQLAADLAESKARQRAEAKTATAFASRQRELDVISRRVDLLLAELAPGAFADDRALAIAAAAKAIAADPPEAGRLHVDHLSVIISGANKRAEDAQKAAHLLQGLGFDPLPGELDRQDLAVRDQLERVASGESGLDDELTEDAHRVLRKVEAGGMEMFLREQITQIMRDNNWEVEEGFSTVGPGAGRMTLTRSEWTEHHLRIFLDGSQLSYVTLRDFEVPGDQAGRLDHERCGEGASGIEVLFETLTSRGAEVTLHEQRTWPAVAYLGKPHRDTTHDRGDQKPAERSLDRPTTQE